MLASVSIGHADATAHPATRLSIREPWTTAKHNPRAEARLSRSQGAPGTDRPDPVVVAGSLLELVRFAANDPQPWRFTIALPGEPSLGPRQIADLANEWRLLAPSDAD
jgi:hypothetical protein